MLSKRNLKRLEGLLLLISIFKTKSKRHTAAIMRLSVDTVTKYIALLEADIGSNLLVNGKKSCTLNSLGQTLVNQTYNLYTEELFINNNPFNLSNLKNLRGAFYLKAVASFGNKRLASEQLAASVETINLYIDYLEYSLRTRLLHSDNQGSSPTLSGQQILTKFDILLQHANSIIKIAQKQNFRIALTHDIQISPMTKKADYPYDIIVFADSPYLHSAEWDMAITYFQPSDKDMIILRKKKIPCGFFASQEYINKYGTPKDIEDVMQNHQILDGSFLPYADKKYRSLIKNCYKICSINDSSIVLSDMARYGTGICIIPLTSSHNDLLYLDYLPCEANATLYLSIHKNIRDVPRFQPAIVNCLNILAHL